MLVVLGVPLKVDVGQLQDAGEHVLHHVQYDVVGKIEGVLAATVIKMKGY
jgi:hypothetical protein